MPNEILTIVVSHGQSRNPEKRALEDALLKAASSLAQTRVLSVPHLYDLAPKGESLQCLRSVEGPLLIFSWLFERPAHWVLDRNGVRGQVGEVELKGDEEEDEVEEEESSEDDESRVIAQYPRPSRKIYCVDLRVRETVEPFVEELRRIYESCREEARQSTLESARQRFENPVNSTALAIDGSGKLALQDTSMDMPVAHEQVLTVAEHPQRRWYPVIDFSRCTNCMECIDFCLFGVYGVDDAQTILVEQPDNCRKGCPACSRVCPSNAIMFPQHKTPAIAGAQVDAGSMKIDLSKLFGAPDREEDPMAAAARERDEQLILAGRSAVGMQGLEQAESTPPSNPTRSKDEFDQLLDQLDSMDL